MVRLLALGGPPAGSDRQRDEGGDDAYWGEGGWGDFEGESGAGGWLSPGTVLKAGFSKRPPSSHIKRSV